jgi:hypothetical protein
LNNFFVCDGCLNSLGFERFMSLADLPLEEFIEVDDGRLQALEAAHKTIEGRRLFCVK